MRLPISWLRDFVDYDGSPEALAERLASSGFEVERIIRLGAPDEADNHGRFVIGKVVYFEQHPNADRLRLCRVDVGEPEPRQIVCGASNFAVDDTVVVALPGALLPGAESPLKQAKLRGEISDGMMLSERELQLSDEHDGIIILRHDPAYDVGSLLADHVALGDAVLDLSVESNRGDCLSIYGMAREVAVLFDLELRPWPGVEPAATAAATSDLVTVGIDAPERCTRFTARGFTGVLVGPSPLWVRQRLAAAGMRPISNVVDVTNYVMHELGNPLHVYDADLVSGRVLTARLAEDGERVTTLDGKERALDADMLVIADADGPSGVAGIMGGAHSEIRASTTNVVLEAACFERGGIQRTAAALGLRTDGSNRWEKGVSPHLAPIASLRAAELICAWSGAQMLAAPQDVAGGLPERASVRLEGARVDGVLGLAVDPAVVERILGGLGYEPEPAEAGWDCRVPFWRWLDATRPIDLVEEVGRVHGLWRIEGELPRVPPYVGGLTARQALRRRIEDHLAGAGLRQVVTVSLVDPERQAVFATPADAVALRNPLSADLSELRTSLLPSLIDVVRRNRAVGQGDVLVYEIGNVHSSAQEGSPTEGRRLAIALAGHAGGDSWMGVGVACDFGLAVGVLDALFARLGIACERESLADDVRLHPGRAARLVVGDHLCGIVGELHPALAGAADLEGPIAIAELDLAVIEAAAGATARFQGLSSFPPVRQDIAVIVDRAVPAARLLETARDAGGDLLADVSVFDVYEGEQFGAERTSIGLRLVVQAADRTLTEDEATAVRDRIVMALAERHGAELRA